MHIYSHNSFSSDVHLLIQFNSHGLIKMEVILLLQSDKTFFIVNVRRLIKENDHSLFKCIKI